MPCLYRHDDARLPAAWNAVGLLTVPAVPAVLLAIGVPPVWVGGLATAVAVGLLIWIAREVRKDLRRCWAALRRCWAARPFMLRMVLVLVAWSVLAAMLH